MIEFHCQHCGTLLRLNETLAGRDGWCRECKRMVIVPDGGPAIHVEDLPPGQAIERLQQLLRYAASKADQYKLYTAGRAREEQLKANLEANARESRKALAAQIKRYDTLQGELETTRQSLTQAEARLASLEPALRLADGAPAEKLKAEIATLEAALAAERKARDAIEQEANTRESELHAELTTLEADLAAEREARSALEQQASTRDAELRAEIATLEAALTGEREARSTLEQQASTRDAELHAEIATLEAALTGEREVRGAIEQRANTRDAELWAEIATLEADLASEREARDAIEQRASTREAELHAEIATLEADLAAEREARSALDQQTESQGAEIRELYDALDRQQEAEQIALAQASNLGAELSTTRTLLKQFERKLQDARDEFNLVQRSGDSVRDAYAQLESELASLRLQLKATEEERDRLKCRLEDVGRNEHDTTGAVAEKVEKTSADHAERVLQAPEAESGTHEHSEPIRLLELRPAQPAEADSETPAQQALVEARCADNRPSGKLPIEMGSVSPRHSQVVSNARQVKVMPNIEKETFVERWRREAEVDGAQRAQFRLGVRYQQGLGLPRDDAEAVRWFTTAAEQGHAGAQYQLGRMYAEGRGVARNFARALDWFRKAAEQDEAGAQCELGLMCLNGTGVTRDENAALAWFRKAAEQDDPRALYHLGLLHAEGSSAPANPAQALDCFLRAAQQGHADSQYQLGRMLLDGTGVARDECLALDWFHKAAEQGQIHAQYALGMCLEEGRGVVQNYIRAYAWYSLASVRLVQARAARDQLATTMLPEQLLQGQQLAEEMHTMPQTDSASTR